MAKISTIKKENAGEVIECCKYCGTRFLVYEDSTHHGIEPQCECEMLANKGDLMKMEQRILEAIADRLISGRDERSV
jgi:hypothetical protein